MRMLELYYKAKVIGDGDNMRLINNQTAHFMHEMQATFLLDLQRDRRGTTLEVVHASKLTKD